MKTPIAYYGGKQQLAGKIVRILAQAPAQKIYCEPFFGGGAVFFARGGAEHEVINDTNRIYLNILAKNPRSEALGYTANTAAMLHEWGHWLDQNMTRDGKTLREQMPDLGRLLEEDAVLYTRHLIKPEEVIKTGSDLAALPRDMRGKIEDNLNEDRDLKNGVSDIFSGLTKNAIGGRWGHKWDYWEKPGSLEKEAVAHFFEARAAGGRKLEILKAYFPSAYGYFENTLKGF